MTAPNSRAAGVFQQSVLLARLWWLSMRRRPRRLGDAPKQSGIPTFLLINLLSIAYIAPLAYATVQTSVKAALGNFAWHALGIPLVGLGNGLSPTQTTFQARGARDDTFLESLPVQPLARLTLLLIDSYMALIVALVVPLAGVMATGSSGLSAVAAAGFGWFLYATFILVGRAIVGWTKVWGPASAGRSAGYVGTGLSLLGFVSMFFPAGRLLVGESPMMIALSHWWLRAPPALASLYAGSSLLAFAAYFALRGAERAGFDRLEVLAGTPTVTRRGRTRVALERALIWRQGGRALLFVLGGMLVMAALGVERLPGARMRAPLLMITVGLVLYLGAIQTIALAGRSARSDLVARPFLSALPLAPHQVLEGKASVLRGLLIPAFLAFAYLAQLAVRNGHQDVSYRTLLSAMSLYVAVNGAVAIAFLSSGVGVVGVAGGQASSSFSTQLLLMPLLATVVAPDGWAAFVAFVAVLLVSKEARRAAQRSVRWLDDPDDAVERETSVWRALLAASVFFAVQMFSARTLALFQVGSAYTLTIGFFAASCMLALLTWRNSARFDRPAIAPRALWYWPLGLLAGVASGATALALAERLLGPGVERTQPPTAMEIGCLALTLVVVAPLAEEYFFRGWLQRAIESDLPAARKPLAFVLAALAFALAHVGSYGLPQFVLGLAAGALVARGAGLGPAMLAHAAHNGFILWSVGR